MVLPTTAHWTGWPCASPWSTRGKHRGQMPLLPQLPIRRHVDALFFLYQSAPFDAVRTFPGRPAA